MLFFETRKTDKIIISQKKLVRAFLISKEFQILGSLSRDENVQLGFHKFTIQTTLFLSIPSLYIYSSGHTYNLAGVKNISGYYVSIDIIFFPWTTYCFFMKIICPQKLLRRLYGSFIFTFCKTVGCAHCLQETQCFILSGARK